MNARPRTNSFQSIISYDGKDEGVIMCPICFNEAIEYFTSPCKHSWCNICHNSLMDNKCPICRKIIKDLPFKYKLVKGRNGVNIISIPIEMLEPPTIPPPPPPRTPVHRTTVNRNRRFNDCCVII